MAGKKTPRRHGSDEPQRRMSTVIAETFDLYAEIGPLVCAARALLRVSQTDLAQRAGVSVATISRMESGRSISRLSRDCFRMVITVLEAEGIEFRLPDRQTGGPRGVLLAPYDETVYHGNPNVSFDELATKKPKFPSDHGHLRVPHELSLDKTSN